MKKLGLVGGMGPESTIPYYRGIVYGVRERMGEKMCIRDRARWVPKKLDAYFLWMTGSSGSGFSFGSISSHSELDVYKRQPWERI